MCWRLARRSAPNIGILSFGYSNTSKALPVRCVHANFAFIRFHFHSDSAVHSQPWPCRLVSTNRNHRSDGCAGWRFLPIPCSTARRFHFVGFLPIRVIVWTSEVLGNSRSPVTALTRGDGFARHTLCVQLASLCSQPRDWKCLLPVNNSGEVEAADK